MSFRHAKVVWKDRDSRAYHALKNGVARGQPGLVVSPSVLKTFAECPERFIHGYQPPASESKDWGNWFDCLVLTPTQWDDRYAVTPKEYVDAKGNTKKWRDDNRIEAVAQWKAEHEGKETVSYAQMEKLKQAVSRLFQDELLASFIGESDKQVEVVGEWHDADTGLVIPVSCLIDLVPRGGSEFAQCLGDLKTTRSGNRMAWERWSSQARLNVQAAFDLDLYNAATQENRDTWCFVLSENYHPWQPGRRVMELEKVELGRALYRGWLAWYCRCLKSGRWSDYDDHPGALQGWSKDRATMSDRKAVEAMLANEPDTDLEQIMPVEDEVIP